MTATRKKTSDIIVMLKRCHYVMSHHSIIRNFWGPFLNMKMWYLMLSKKIDYLCEDRIDKSVFRDHTFLLVGKPHNAKG